MNNAEGKGCYYLVTRAVRDTQVDSTGEEIEPMRLVRILVEYFLPSIYLKTTANQSFTTIPTTLKRLLLKSLE